MRLHSRQYRLEFISYPYSISIFWKYLIPILDVISVYPLHCYHTDTHTITNNHEMGGCVTYVGNRGGCLCRGIGLWELEGLRSRTDSGWRFEVGLRPIQAFELRVPVINSSPMSIFKGSAEQDTHALYQKSCHTLLRGLMSRSKKLLRLNRGCQPTDL